MNTKECPFRPKAPCTKQKCAWYLVHSKQCAIPLLASEFQKIRIQLYHLSKEAGYGIQK